MDCGFGVAVAVKNHLALLGKLDAIAHRVGRLGTNGLAGGASAPANAAATSAEQPRRYIVLAAQRNHLLLGQVRTPDGSQDAAILARDRLAQHELLATAHRRTPRPIP